MQIRTVKKSWEVEFTLDRVMAIEEAMGKSVLGLVEDLIGVKLGSGQPFDPAAVMGNLSVRKCAPFVAACIGEAPADLGQWFAPAELLSAAMSLMNALFSEFNVGQSSDPQTGPTAPVGG